MTSFLPQTKKTSEQSELCSDVVREAGVEPARPCEHWHLKPASLPIPPLVHQDGVEEVRSSFGASDTIARRKGNVNNFFRKSRSFSSGGGTAKTAGWRGDVCKAPDMCMAMLLPGLGIRGGRQREA